MGIIAISGKIGSGKDLCGKIIQYLIYDKLMIEQKKKVLYYYPVDVFIEELKNNPNLFEYEQHTWKVKKFAKKLKEIASILTGIPIEKFENQEFKKTFLSEEWNREIASNGYFFEAQMTVRELLQKLGTEALRNGLHENVWVNALFTDYKFEGCKNNDTTCETPNGDCNSSLCYPNWIITDLRFPNEFEAIKQRNGICVNVNRDYVLRDAEEDPKNLHYSEIALDQHKFNWEIQNDGTIKDLVEEVRKMLINFNII